MLDEKAAAFYAGFDKQSFKIDPIGPTAALRERIARLENALAGAQVALSVLRRREYPQKADHISISRWRFAQQMEEKAREVLQSRIGG